MSESRLEIAVDPAVPDFLFKDVSAKLPYADERIVGAEIAAGGALVTVTLKVAPTDVADAEGVAGRVRTIVRKMAKGAFRPDLKVVVDQRDRAVPCADDPMAALLARREVVREGAGFFALGPLMSRLIDYLEAEILRLAADFGAEPYRFPALISPAYMEKVKYFSNFPHSLSFVAHLREDLDILDAFMQSGHAVDGEVDAPEDAYARAKALLSPTVCHHLYLMLADSDLPADGIVATAVGHCFRYESINMVSLQRVWNFTMREIIFVGTPEQVQERLEALRAATVEMLDVLGMAYCLENANDPFFIGSYRDQAAYQAAFDLKFEVRAPLPFKGDGIAIGSFNYHKDFFGRSLDIRAANGSKAHTGCLGFGFERWAYAFLCQFGLDPASWPAGPRGYFEAHPPRRERPTFTSAPSF